MVNHSTLQQEKNAALVKQLAKEAGFLSCGISKAGFLEQEAPRLETWLNLNHHGEMGYMANHFDKRLNPTLLVPDAKSVISLLYNYYPAERLAEDEADFKISKYAYGEDYHVVIRQKLNALVEAIRQHAGDVNGRAFVDSAPVMEKAWAAKSGIGWVGKNSNLLSREHGSFFFVAEIICDLELQPDVPINDYCGTCTRCIDACPTDAIAAPFVVDGSRCISYFTIELKDAIPAEMKGLFGNWVFGCDICQDVCPWNRFSKPHNEPAFALNPAITAHQQQAWQDVTEDVFKQVFKTSAVKRSKFAGFKRNVEFVKRS